MKILVTEKIGEAGLKILEESNHEILERFGITYDELLTEIQDVDALIVRTRIPIDENLLSHGKKLSVVGMHGIGLNHIDAAYAKAHGIEVLNVPAASRDSVVELTMGLIFCIARKMVDAGIHVKDGGWKSEDFVGTELTGKTLGVLGLGAIGRRVADMCRFLGMSVVAYDPFYNQDDAKDFRLKDTVEEVVSVSDVITIHVPLTEQTKDLIHEDMLDLMKDGVILINVARGKIISEATICKGLRTGKFSGAGLDVTDEEPISPDSELFQYKNVVITPHIGARTKEAQTKVSITICNHTLDFLNALQRKQASQM